MSNAAVGAKPCLPQLRAQNLPALVWYTACRPDAQTSPSELIREDVMTPVTKALQDSLPKLLHCPTTSAIWEHASLPVRCGGLGLQEPADSDPAEAARLASLVSIVELLPSLAIPPNAYETEVNLPLKAFNTR